MTQESSEDRRMLGRYRLLDQLATGGMAVVHLAIEHGAHGLERPLVIKQLQSQHDDESSQRMLLQEARLAARINHPNVVEIHELGTDGQRPFIAMEFVPGAQLRELCRAAWDDQVAIPIGVAVGIVLQACAGAHAAHELRGPDGQAENLVHRDLSPHNLMVGAGGHVKVLDFGVAKAEFNPDKTQTGVLKGKYAYMSPEQLESGPIDRRSDLFTLATVLWELIIGRQLFGKMSAIRTIHSVLNGEIKPVHMERSEVPADLSAVIARALQRDPAERYQTVDEFRRALQHTAQEAGIDTTTDAIGEFVRAQVGSMVEERQDWVDSRVSRALKTEVDFEATTLGVPPSPDVRQQSIHSVSTVYESEDASPPSQLSKLVFGLLGVVVILAVAFWAIGASQFEGSDSEDPESVLTGEPVVIALAPTMARETLEEGWDPIREHIETQLGRPVVVRVADSYPHTSELLLSGEVDFAILPPTLYIDAKLAEPDLNLMMVAKHDGAKGYDGVLLVRKDSGIETLEDLRGKRICYTNQKSTTGYLLPRIFLIKNGLDPDDLFSQELMQKDHARVIQGLSDNLCDVAGTTGDFHHEAAELGGSKSGLRLFRTTGHLPNDAICSAPGLDPELVSSVEQILLTLDPQEDLGVSRVGRVEKISGFALTTDQAYDELRLNLEVLKR
jgi:phosphate/phosphite/phosphonate ABC transporter binding protein